MKEIIYFSKKIDHHCNIINSIVFRGNLIIFDEENNLFILNDETEKFEPIQKEIPVDPIELTHDRLVFYTNAPFYPIMELKMRRENSD